MHGTEDSLRERSWQSPGGQRIVLEVKPRNRSMLYVGSQERHEFVPDKGRGIRTRIKVDEENLDKLIVCDIPTTLSAVIGLEL